MPQNRLTNEHFDTAEEVREFYKNFLLDIGDLNVLSQINLFRGLKLISRQYVAARQRVQQLTDLHEIIDWFQTHQLDLFNVPLNYNNSDRTPGAFVSMEITEIEEELLDEDFNGHDLWEPLRGPGWTGECRFYIAGRSSRYDEIALKNAMASHGFYTRNMGYDVTDEDKRYVEASFMILQRDFKLEVDAENWNVIPAGEEDEGDDEEFFRLQDINDRIEEIEEGLLDDEDPRI